MREVAEAPSHAIRTFCMALFLNFNRKIYEAGGGLVAWPSWETLKTKFGINEFSIREAVGYLERRGSIRVERGRQGQRRAVNKYHAVLNPRIPRVENGGQPEISQPENFSVDSLNIDSLNRLDSLSQSLDSVKESRTPEQAALRPEAEKAANGSSDSVVLSSLKTPHPQGAARPPSPEHGEAVLVRYDTPLWYMVERYSYSAVGKSFPRIGRRAEGQWILKSDLKAIEAVANGGGDL